jgi:hypothetical protein
VKLDGGDGERSVQIAFQRYRPIMGANYLISSAARFRSGQVELAGRSYRAALVDADWDGRYDGAFSAQGDWTGIRPRDWMAIDLDGNGKFDGTHEDSDEIMPLPGMLRVGGAYYSVAPSADGSALRIEGTDPELGTLQLASTDLDVRLWSSNGSYRLAGGTEWELPAGVYRPVRVGLSRTDEKGIVWTLTADDADVQLRANIEVPAGGTTAPTIGPPLVVQATIENVGGWFSKRIQMGLRVLGRGGEQYAAAAQRNGRRLGPPAFKIIDESGKVLATGSFEYG